VSFALGNIVNGLPFPDDYFDTINCAHVLKFLSPEELKAAFKEINRIIKPG